MTEHPADQRKPDTGLAETTGLVARGLTKSFDTAAGSLAVLTGVDLDVKTGGAVAIVGASGSGKSTLLQILGGLDQPDAGRLQIGDDDPLSMSTRQLAEFRNRAVGFVFQDHHLLPQLSVLENVLVPTLARGKSTAAQVDRAKMLIDAVGLADRIEHRPGALSGGQRERVAIARSLVMAPRVLLADEPTGNLDRQTAAEVTELLLRLRAEENVALIAVTHSPTLAAAMDRQLELIDGQLRPVDSLASLSL